MLEKATLVERCTVNRRAERLKARKTVNMLSLYRYHQRETLRAKMGQWGEAEKTDLCGLVID
jgi:hypothetical protein